MRAARSLVVAALVAIGAVATGAVAGAAQRPVPPQPAQPGPPPRSELRAREIAVVIDGCIENRRLRPAAGVSTNPHEEVLRATEYILEGPRELLSQLAQAHRGHHEEIVGVAILPPTPAGETVDTRTREIGGVRITGGVRQAGGSTAGNAGAMVDAPKPVRVRVKAARHLADGCAPRSD